MLLQEYNQRKCKYRKKISKTESQNMTKGAAFKKTTSNYLFCLFVCFTVFVKTNKRRDPNLKPLSVAERRQGSKAFLPVQNIRGIVD